MSREPSISEQVRRAAVTVRPGLAVPYPGAERVNNAQSLLSISLVSMPEVRAIARARFNLHGNAGWWIYHIDDVPGAKRVDGKAYRDGWGTYRSCNDASRPRLCGGRIPAGTVQNTVAAASAADAAAQARAALERMPTRRAEPIRAHEMRARRKPAE